MESPAPPIEELAMQGMVDDLRVPPHNIQAEQSLLGGLMLDNSTWDRVADLVVEQDFYRREHRLAFGAVKRLADANQPFDVVTLAETLERNEELEDAGGLPYIGGLVKDTPSAANIQAYAKIVRFYSVLRQLIAAGTAISDLAYNPQGREASEILDEAERRVFEIAEQLSRGGGGFEPLKALLVKAVERIDTLYNSNDAITGLPTGFKDFDAKTSGLQRSDLIIVAGRPSMGKCLGKGTLVLLHSGELRPVEELQVGDLLMGVDSAPHKILSLARGRERMYWVRQNKGIDYRVNESHILSLKRSRSEGVHQHGDILNISVMDYLGRSDKFRNNYKGYKVAVELSSKELPIEPYFLGLWLGEGNSGDVRISTRDPEVVVYLQDYANRLGLHLSEQVNGDKCPLYAISSGNRGGNQAEDDSLQRSLRRLGVLGDKHIPADYLSGDSQQRLQLLAGLIDSDGYFDAQCGGMEITHKSASLAREIKFLGDTLGFRTSLISKEASIWESGFSTTVHRIRFFGDLDRIPVRIPRKQGRPWDCRRSWNQTGIQVEYDKVDDYYGFELDGSGLFLLEDMTVTHNTTFAMNMAENVALETKRPVAVFSMEMPGDGLAMRMMSSLGRIDQHRVRTGKLEEDEWPRLTSAVNMLSGTKIFIDDTPALSPTELRARARRLKREQNDLALIVIDYLQLMQAPEVRENRVAEISAISRNLKSLAKELDIPVVALSQLNRSLEQRPNKRPVMSDLRESGAIEQDADVIVFIYRDEVYNEDSKDKGIAEIIIGKQRNGPIGTVRLTFLGKYTKFENFIQNVYEDDGY